MAKSLRSCGEWGEIIACELSHVSGLCTPSYTHEKRRGEGDVKLWTQSWRHWWYNHYNFCFIPQPHEIMKVLNLIKIESNWFLISASQKTSDSNMGESQLGRAGNSLIGFLSESLVFCEKMSKWAICSKEQAIRSFALFWWATWAIRSWSLIFGEQPEQITHGHSFLVSNLSDLLTSLIFLNKKPK